jgi:hypothetical protein
MARRKNIKQLTGGLNSAKSKYKIRPAPATLPINSVKQFESQRQTSAGRKALAPQDRQRLEDTLGKDWQTKVFGDAERYKRAQRVNRNTRERVTGLRKQESELKSQVGTPGASDEALQRRIEELQNKEGKVQRKHALAKGTVQRGKRRFERAAKEAFVSDQKNVQQKRAQELGAAVKDRFDSKMNLPIYRNPNSSAKEKQRKQAVRKKIRGLYGKTPA